MTDLEKLSKFSQEDVKRVSEEVWHEISRYCHRQTSTPKLYLIGGQPGAGKSTTINDIEKKLNNDCITINLDDYRSKHPRAHDFFLNMQIRYAQNWC